MPFELGKAKKNKTLNDKIEKTYEELEKYNKYAEKEAKERIYQKKVELQNQFNTYFVVYFDSDEEKIEFCKKNKIDGDYLYGKEVSKIILK
jgi:hypothetical protein